MNLTALTAQVALEVALVSSGSFTASPTDEHDDLGPRVVPRDVADFLARLRLLEGVPFAYLVPDVELLPPESIRFFYLDRAWTDALVQGALSVGTITTADHAQLENVYPVVRAEVDEGERLVRVPGHERTPQGEARTITGLVLRSRAVSGWPGLHVRAYREELGVADDAQIPESDPRRVKLLRLERLAPAVLLALFDGVPAVVHIEEPRQGIQFGVRPPENPPADPNQRAALVPPRNISSGNQTTNNEAAWAKVKFRRNAPGVISMKKTREELLGKPGTGMGTDLDSAEFAIQMLRYPYRQVFGDPGAAIPPEIDDVFRPRIDMTRLQTLFTQALDR